MPISRYFATNLSASTYVSFFLSSFQISHLIPRVCSLTTLSTTCPATFSRELFIAIPHRDRTLHSRCVSLLEETVYPVVHLPPRCTSKPFPVSPLRLSIIFSNDEHTRLNCFPIRYLLNIWPCWIKREFIIFLPAFANFLYLFCFYNSMLAFFSFATGMNNDCAWS